MLVDEPGPHADVVGGRRIRQRADRRRVPLAYAQKKVRVLDAVLAGSERFFERNP